jgi:hypothetical protein
MSSIKKSRLGGVKTLKVSGILDEFEKDEVKKGVDIVSLFSVLRRSSGEEREELDGAVSLA